MDFIGFTMVKNEEDIIEQSVRHNLGYLKKFYVFDHDSSDNTVRILEKLAAEGLPVVQLFDHGNAFSMGYAQAEIMSTMLRMAITENGAGLYFPLDADEFIHFSRPVDEFRQRIQAFPDNTAFDVPALNMAFPRGAGEALFANAPKSFPLLERRKPCSGPGAKAILKVGDASAAGHVSLVQGNHNFVLDDAVVPKETSLWDAIRYIHVPVRSPEQAYRKFVCGWFANVQKFGKDTPAAGHWKTAFDKICAESGYADPQLAHMLNDIYLGPVDIENDFESFDAESVFKYELRYAAMRKPGLSVILRSLEQEFDKMHRKLVRRA